MADVVITAEARRQFQRLPLSIRARMEKLFVRLSQWPNVSGAKPLSGPLVGCWRMRTGDYRVQFRVVGAAGASASSSTERIIIEKVGHRDGFYED